MTFTEISEMALSTKQLIEKNKAAYKSQFYIESIYISRALATKALRQIISDENIIVKPQKVKLGDCIKILKTQYDRSPLLNKKLKRSVYKNICAFNTDYKLLNKELKYQFPDTKLKHTAKRGIDIIVNLNTALVRLRSNR